MIEALAVGVVVGLLAAVPSGLIGYWLCVHFFYSDSDREIVYSIYPWLDVRSWTLRCR